MGCFGGVIENNWVRSANSHPPWPGTAMSNRTWALILSMIESQLFNDDIYLILPSWAVLEASLKIIGSGTARSNRTWALIISMGCYLSVIENHWSGSANSPPGSCAFCVLYGVLVNILLYCSGHGLLSKRN